MITTSNLTKQLNSFRLDSVSFTLPAGFICGLIGENGAGKTTLLNMLSGLYTFDSGEFSVFEMDFLTQEVLIKQDIGVVMQGDMFEPNASLRKSAQRYGRFYPNYEDSLLLSYTERFGLDVTRKYRQLSKGEKLKFALAFALSHQPKLLLLDEPSANFDKEFRDVFHQILREYIKDGEHSVMLSTHVLSDIEQFADYVLMLKKGKQLLFGDIETIRDRYAMVFGETYKIKLLKNRIIHMEEGEFGTKALVKSTSTPFDSALKSRKPTIEELLYHMSKADI